MNDNLLTDRQTDRQTDRKTDRPFISIIIPIYNVEKWLNECLESCVTQDVAADEYEIICVDDGSTDNCGNIVDEYTKKYSQIIPVHKENGGLSSARNAGLEIAKGDYIWFVDGDDFISYNCLKDITECLKKSYPDLLFVKPIAFNDGIDTQKMRNGNVVADDTTDFYFDMLWTRLYKKDCIENSKIRFAEGISMAEDNLFCSELNQYIETSDTIERIAYFYRKREGSLTTTPSIKKIGELIDCCGAFICLKERCPNLTETANRQIIEFSKVIMSNLAKLPSKDAKPYMKKLKEYKLYPLKRVKKYDENIADSSEIGFDDKILAKMKNRSYTRWGYNSLRAFRKCLKIKRKFVR